MATSSTQQPIVWAHDLDSQSKKEAFRSFINNKMTRLPNVASIWAEDVFIIGEEDGPKYHGYLSSQYCGPYKWDELPSLFENDTDLCATFFKYFANRNKSFGPSQEQYWKGMGVLLRYASLDKHTLPALRDRSLEEVNIYLLPRLISAPPEGIEQGLLEHAFENTLLLLLGTETAGKKLQIAGLVTYRTSRMPEIAQCYYLLSTVSRDKMEFMCTNFTEQLKELEEKILGLLGSDSMWSYRFREKRLGLIVQADLDRLLQSPGNPSSVKALSGNSDLLLERWVKQGLQSVCYYKTFRGSDQLQAPFALYYHLRTLPAREKELLLSINEELFTDLEEYVLACICNPGVRGSPPGYWIHASDEERPLSQVGNTTLLNAQNNWLRTKVLGKIAGIPDDAQTSYETSLDAITRKYLDWNYKPPTRMMPVVAEAGGGKNPPLVHEGLGVAAGFIITGEDLDRSLASARGGPIETETSATPRIANQSSDVNLRRLSADNSTPRFVKSDDGKNPCLLPELPRVNPDYPIVPQSLDSSPGLVRGGPTNTDSSADSSPGLVRGGPTNTDSRVDNQVPNRFAAVTPDHLDTQRRSEEVSGPASKGVIKEDNQVTDPPTVAKPMPPTNPGSLTSPSILEVSCAIGLLLTLTVVVRYFMYGRSWGNALGIHYVSAARGFPRGAPIQGPR